MPTVFVYTIAQVKNPTGIILIVLSFSYTDLWNTQKGPLVMRLCMAYNRPKEKTASMITLTIIHNLSYQDLNMHW